MVTKIQYQPEPEISNRIPVNNELPMMKITDIYNLWFGEEFLYEGERWRIIARHQYDEVWQAFPKLSLAVKILMNQPAGETRSFPHGTLIEPVTRYV